ncbi:hypothetical protein ACVWZA_001834, partial [Sphingomonas sp. UYAg733]
MFDEMFHHRVEIIKDVLRLNTQGHDTFARDPIVAFGIPRRLIAPPVRFSIDFDRDQGVAAIEVDRIGTGGMLSPKLDAGRPAAQHGPQSDLGQRHRAPKSARLPDRLARTTQHSACPLYLDEHGSFLLEATERRGGWPPTPARRRCR